MAGGVTDVFYVKLGGWNNSFLPVQLTAPGVGGDQFSQNQSSCLEEHAQVDGKSLLNNSHSTFRSPPVDMHFSLSILTAAATVLTASASGPTSNLVGGQWYDALGVADAPARPTSPS